jgi:hypothetical protein
MMVPLSEEVARRVPSALRATHERGDLWASITFTASSLRASNSKTSPVRGAGVPAAGGAWEGGLKGEGLLEVGRG